MAAAGILFTFWFLVGGFIYVALIRQIVARSRIDAPIETPAFGLPESILAFFFIGLLLWSILTAGLTSQSSEELTSRSIVGSLLVTVALVGVIVFVLKMRGRNVAELAGFSKFGAMRAIITGAVLLFLAYPSILLADRLAQRILHTGSSKQSIVELFSSSQTLNQRILIIIFAVTLAPAAEEFIFRFFIYGVLKRHFGMLFALAANALLFAAVHGHLPSFGALCVLAGFFTIAYEWSGSLLVPMTMHSIFNAMTLVVLAFPDVLGQ